jgi:fatty acid desaturase
LNAGFILLVTVIAALAFGVFPLLFVPQGWPLAALAAAVLISTPLHWGLIHESIHGSLSRDPARNRDWGRFLAVLLCLSWETNRFGHLTHHRANRNPLDRPEERPEGSSWLEAAPLYYLKLLGGHALVAAVAPLVILIPDAALERAAMRMAPDSAFAAIRDGAVQSLRNPARRARIRLDLAATLLLVGIALLCWGAHWPIFLALIAGRFAILSLLDNAHHYGTPLDSGTTADNSRLPGWAAWLVLNQNLHGRHHENPHLSWWELRSDGSGDPTAYAGSWPGIVLRQLRGPIPLARGNAHSAAASPIGQAMPVPANPQ